MFLSSSGLYLLLPSINVIVACGAVSFFSWTGVAVAGVIWMVLNDRCLIIFVCLPYLPLYHAVPAVLRVPAVRVFSVVCSTAKCDSHLYVRSNERYCVCLIFSMAFDSIVNTCGFVECLYAVIQLLQTRNAQKLAQCVISIDFRVTDGLLHGWLVRNLLYQTDRDN